MRPTPETLVSDIVARFPRTSAVFERYGIDYCCHGRRPLREACAERDVSVDSVLQEIEPLIAEGTPEEENWLDRSLCELCDHIESTHHVYLRQELPALGGLVRKVREVHETRHPELRELENVFAGLSQELTMHMIKEEKVLFPAIRMLEQAEGPVAFPFGSLANPIGVMESEHDSAATALQRVRELTEGHTVPEDACNSYRAMIERLKHLEEDLHVHISKENNILFPRALELEQRRRGR